MDKQGPSTGNFAQCYVAAWMGGEFGVQFSPKSCPTLRPHGLQHARLPCPSSIPGACSNACPLSQWCHPTTSSSVVPFSCLQSFPASGSFPLSQFFTSGGQRIGASALASVLLVNIQGWFPLRLTSLISLLTKGLSRVFSSTIIKKNQFFSAQTLTSIPDYWKKHSFDYMDFCQQMMSLLFNMLCWS